MNNARYLDHFIEQCTDRINELTDLLPLFSSGELHTKKTKHGTEYLIHTKESGITKRTYIHKRNRPVARELAIKADVQAELEECKAELALFQELQKNIENLPHSRELLRSEKGFSDLLNEGFTLLNRNGTFFTENEWIDLITGHTDGQFREISNPEYRRISLTGRQLLKGLRESEIPDSATAFLQKHPDQRALEIRNHVAQTNSDALTAAWLAEPYVKCRFRPNELIYPTYDGERMRSKLEVHTAEILKSLGIAYRYEAQLLVGHETYYPDFTLYHPGRRSLIYLEIFGKMSNPTYRADTALKLKNYTLNSFILGKNLLCYTETDDDPLDFALLKTDLEHIFR